LLATLLVAALFSLPVHSALADGACCIEAEEDCRQVTNPLPCASIGGVYVEGGSCAEGVCDPGACCDGASCSIMTGVDCLNGGLNFLGGGTSCNDDPCGVVPVGACCTGEACTEVSEAVCAASSGNWLGAAVSCGTAPCSPGACCSADDTCSETLPLACQQAGGAFQPGATCAGGACGVGGCCDGLSCSISSAYDCAVAGRQFGGAGTTCLDDPCDAGIGACCLAGACSDASPEDCSFGGGTWLGAGTNCTQDPCVIGACCRPGECDDLARYECAATGGAFFGESTCGSEEACAATLDCDGDSLVAQSPIFGAAGVSDFYDGTYRWDNYSQALGAVETVRFWGLDLERSSGSFIECVDSNPTFLIEFYDDQNGQPGNVVCGHTVTATRTPTGQFVQDFAEVNEYEVELPFPCVQPNGWISIVGLGDQDCIFLWSSSNDGGDGAYCVGCGFPPDDGYDLAFCLGGERGGVFGACCDEGLGVCQDNTEIDQCAGVGMRFYQDFTCQDIGPCDIITGACCHDDGTACEVVTQAACASAGGNWLGQFSECFQCPAVGACCIQDDICVVTTDALCDTEYGTWIGDGTTCGDCPAIPPHCPEESLLSYQADPPHGFIATTSEFDPGFSIANYFEDADGAITGLTWFGFDLEYRPDLGGFIECTEFDNTFDITFHADAAGVPGAVVCDYTVFADRVETGIVSYRGAMLNEYSVTLPSSCVLTNGWVRIVARGATDCWFLWLSGDSPAQAHCTGCGTTLIAGRNMCLAGQAGGVFGACCDDATGICSENVEISNCAATGQRFLADGVCADLPVPCGEFIGACCISDATCSVGSEADCVTAGGSWLGADSLCSECPCLVPCPSGSASEGEPVCFNGYVDETNGGCFATTPAFSPITPGVTVCGTGGVWEGPGGFVGDWDIYEFQLDHPAELTFTVLAEYAVIAAIYDGSAGCPGELLSAFADFACDSANASATVGPGTYWLATRVLAASDESQCGQRYTALLTVEAVSLGDGDGDGDVDLDDHLIFVDCMAGPAAEPAPTAPRTPQECLDAFDADFDGDVDCEDATAFQRSFEG
jgi:hypothetical protein